MQVTLEARLHVLLIPLVMALSDVSSAESIVGGQQIYDEVVVTARKREESLHRVPISITHIDKERIQSPLMGDLSGVGALAPNLDFNWTAPFSGSSNAASVFIRGIGQNDFLLTTDPGVGIYLDGVHITRSVGGVLGLTDIERVEVLRGPQGTLFGKNSIGGAVQVISRKPENAFKAGVSATVGDFGRRDLSVSVEGGLRENLQGRLSLSSDTRDGYVRRLTDGRRLGDIDRQSAKLTFTYQPADNADWMLSVDHTKQRQEAIAQTLLEVTPATLTPHRTLFNTLVAPPGTPYDDRWITGDWRVTHQDGPSRDDMDVVGVSLSGNYEYEWGQLTSVTGVRHLNAIYARDSDGSPLDYAHSINHDQHRQISQEFRIQGDGLEDRLDWLVGLYYSRERGENLTEGVLWSGLYGATGDPMLDFDFEVNNDIRTRSFALFSQLNYRFSDPLSVTLGVRLTREDKEFHVDNYQANAGGQIVGPARVQDDWFNVSPMLSTDYRLNEHWMTYLSFAGGFKSGGFNGRQIFPGPVDRYDREFAVTLELGLKANLWNGRVNFQVAIFDSDYEDMQFTVLEAGVIPVINNAAHSRIQGLELELGLTDWNGLSLQTGIGYLDARYESLDPGVVITKDMDLVRVPRWNAHLEVGYSWHWKELGRLRISGNASYKSKVYHDPTNTEAIAQDNLILLSTSLEWLSRDENWSLGAFATNLSDERYFVSGVSESVSIGASEVNYARGREWGVRVKRQF